MVPHGFFGWIMVRGGIFFGWVMVLWMDKGFLSKDNTSLFSGSTGTISNPKTIKLSKKPKTFLSQKYKQVKVFFLSHFIELP